MKRRQFLELGFGAAAFFGGFRNAGSSSSQRTGVLVVVFQRGAADGLHMVVPYRDPKYRALRGAIALEEPGTGDGNTLDLGDGFAFHPALLPLHSLYAEGRLAVVVNVGSPDNTRSHFDAQNFMESGTPGRKSTRDGWLGRAVAALEGGSPFTAVALSASLPRSLAGADDVLALEDFRKLDARKDDRALEERIQNLYRKDTSPEFVRAGEEAFRALKTFREKDPLSSTARAGARYPRGRLGPRFSQLAQLIKADLGIRVALVESEGWDTHFAQGGASGSMARSLGELAGSISAFLEDLGADFPVALLTMTEFGRAAAVNGAGGTDHGHGTVMLVGGPEVGGGRVVGDWLSLDSRNLFEGRDLPVTTDFRDLFHEVAQSALATGDGLELFPGYRPSRVGIMASARGTVG